MSKRYVIDPKTHRQVQCVVATTNGRRDSLSVGGASLHGRRIIVQPEATTQYERVMAERQYAPKPVPQWINPDVHARTPEMRALLLSEFPELPKLTRDRSVVPKEIERVMLQIRGQKLPPQAEACLEKIYNRRGAIDVDLCDVSVAGLLCMVWSDCVLPRIHTSLDLFIGTLCDMGTTCVQGDSHRLFAAYVAYKRDELDCLRRNHASFT